MGYSLSWLAIRSKPPQNALGELGFCKTGDREEIPESDFSATELQSGWYVIVANRSEQVASDNLLWRVTTGCEAVTCFVEEHVMFSSASGWKDGRNCWSITHNAQQGIEHLEAGGELPEAFEAIRNEMLTKQKEENVRMAGIRRPLFRPRSVRFSEMSVDYVFEIPVAVARELTGYQHDRQIPGLTGQAFEVLARTRPERPTQESRPSIWKRLFRV